MSGTPHLLHLLLSATSRLRAAFLFAGVLLGCALAQDAATVPRLLEFNGALAGPAPAAAAVTFALYIDQTDRVPLWQETQTVAVDATGHFRALLGATTPAGIPPEIFSDGSAHWLGIQLEGRPEQPRVLLASVPYALKASDAETLGGLPASAFLRSAPTHTPPAIPASPSGGAAHSAARPVPSLTASGAKPGFIPVFTDTNGDLTFSRLFQSGANVGIGTTAPASPLSVAGVIQSTAGGFKFPDGTTQTSAVTLPVNWKGAAAVGSGVVNVISTSNGPTLSKGQPVSVSAIPSAIVGTATGIGTIAGVTGQTTGNDTTGLAIGVLGKATGPQSIGVLGYSAGKTFPAIMAYSAATSGSVKGLDVEMNSPAATGLGIRFAVAPTSGNMIDIGVGTSQNPYPYFRIDGNGNINTSGALQLGGISSGTMIRATTSSGSFIVDGKGNVSISGNLSVKGAINGKTDPAALTPALSAAGSKPGYLAAFADAAGDLTNSPLFASGAKVGIGTTAPASPLSVAGVIQSTAGGFKFPDGTTQTTAATPPLAWKAAAKAGSGVIGATNTGAGPTLSSPNSASILAVPTAILGASTGGGVTAGVMGQVQSTASGAFGIGLLGVVPPGRNGNAVMGWSGQGSDAAFYGINASSSGKANVYDADVYSSRGGGYRVRFKAASTGSAFEVADTNGNDHFTVDAAGNINSSGSLAVHGSTYLWGQILSPVTFGKGLDVKQSSTFENGLNIKGGLSVLGDLSVSGRISKGSGSFQIDHPLDPANKTLSHSFVESPDMMNIYNGNVVTDSHGLATVQLPAYFEALNRDFRYQLTVIGQFAQAIVAREIENNRFTIQTDKPGVKVSWQVTGIRHDAYADAHRIIVEEDKPAAERGAYLHPELFSEPGVPR